LGVWGVLSSAGACKLPIGVRRRALFARANHRLPRFSNPSSFNDKVNWRIFHDQRPLLEWTCDKLAMKDRAGRVPGLHIPRTLWAGTNLEELTSAGLPEHWVLKPNHRSGSVYFGHGQPDIEQLSVLTAGWLRRFESEFLGEWAYSKARPMLLAEELIGTPGSPPPDYKFFVFEGEVGAVQVDIGRHSVHQRRLYLPDWSPLNVRSGRYALPPVEPPPIALDRMLALAAELGTGFDFIRIDLYDIAGRVFFGEFTPYPGSGLDRFVPASFDAELGARWKLPEPGQQLRR
jgi:TupA-like ATPgrasp